MVVVASLLDPRWRVEIEAEAWTSGAAGANRAAGEGGASGAERPVRAPLWERPSLHLQHSM